MDLCLLDLKDINEAFQIYRGAELQSLNVLVSQYELFAQLQLAVQVLSAAT